MLKNNRAAERCGPCSCRMKAEALARNYNAGRWPHTWAGQGQAPVSNGIEDEDEFFDASPSPVEDAECECQGCSDDSSAATERGRAKLYELLQQHADDTSDVFYDVSEDAGDGLRQQPCPDESQPVAADEKAVPDASLVACQSKHVFAHSIDVAALGVEKTLLSSIEEQDNPNEGSTIEVPLLNNENCDASSSEAIAAENSPNENTLSIIYECDKDDEDLSSIKSDVTTDKATSEHEDNEPVSASSEDSESGLEVTRNADNQELQPEVVLDESYLKDDDTSSTSPVEPSSPPSDVKKAFPSLLLERKFQDDEIRPKLVHSTSLKTGKTPPGTPGRKKIVRFADVLGLDLEDVRQIITSDLPNIPPSAYTDLKLADKDFLSNTQSSHIQTCHLAKTIQSPNVPYPLFAIPGNEPDFMDRVRARGVCLENVTISEFNIQCTCRVMNWGFHKKLIARYTSNEWATSNDIDASYLPHSSQGETDSFRFTIFISSLNRNVKFALRYLVNGKEYWDNNAGGNYCFGYHGNTHHAPESSSTWLHHHFF